MKNVWFAVEWVLVATYGFVLGNFMKTGIPFIDWLIVVGTIALLSWIFYVKRHQN